MQTEFLSVEKYEEKKKKNASACMVLGIGQETMKNVYWFWGEHSYLKGN